jgi:hypothetical protein
VQGKGRILVSLALALALSALVPAGASADRPLGKFYCYAGGTYYGYLKLKASGNYSFNDRYKGTYVYKAARHRVKFTSGYFYPKFVGIHKHDVDDDNAVVYIVLKTDHSTGYRCG